MPQPVRAPRVRPAWPDPATIDPAGELLDLSKTAIACTGTMTLPDAGADFRRCWRRHWGRAGGGRGVGRLDAVPLPLGGGDFGAVAEGRKSAKPISANEDLSATPREGWFSDLSAGQRCALTPSHRT